MLKHPYIDESWPLMSRKVYQFENDIELLDFNFSEFASIRELYLSTKRFSELISFQNLIFMQHS